MQCFSIYAAALCAKYPTRLSELMAYQTIIAKASQRYRWSSWVVYDQNFRQEGTPTSHEPGWTLAFMLNALLVKQSAAKIGAQDVGA